MNLLDYPRPKRDTGIGFHWFPDRYHFEKRYFDIFVPELKAMGASWLLIISDGLNTIPDWFLRGLIEQDIEPIIRIFTTCVAFIDQAGLRQACKHYASLGAHYVHVYNEPNLKVEWAEWNPERLPARFMDHLIPCLETMYSVDGIIPVFTPLAPGGDYWDTKFLKEALAILNQKGKKYLYDKMAIGIHNYAFNKPLDYGKGGNKRWSCSAPFLRPPGCEDQTGFYLFEWYDEIVRQYAGRRLPLIGCENGARLGDAQDPRSPAINEALHAERHAAMGQATMGGELPYYFFNNAFWLLAADDEDFFVRHSWYRPNGEPRLPQSVARLKALPKVKRSMRVHVPSDIRVLMADGNVKPMRLEEYLRGVVPMEMNKDVPLEALKAQAVAARCFASVAVANPRHGAQEADVCTEGHCQAWTERTRPDSDQAVRETEDVVALHSDEVIQAFYFGHCDGKTRNSEEVWARALPYCRSVPCAKPYPVMQGHGVGMCQQGAIAMAEQGATYTDIICHYFTDVELIGTDREPVNTWPELSRGYSSWPRPPRDNGLGIHGGLDFSGKAIAVDVARAQQLKVKWVTLVPEDSRGLRKAASAYWDKGIMPVVRPRCSVDEDHDFVGDALLLREMNIPAYVQVYNAPEQQEEWNEEKPDIRAFASRWLVQAKALVEADAFPGLQVNTVSDLRAVLERAKKEGLEHLFRRAWFSCHNYGLNRPALFPYDETNQKALPVQHPEWEFAGTVDEVNRWREEDKQPGQSVYEDYRCVLGFLAYARAFEEGLGYIPPIICTEGGWKFGDLTDRRYPKVSDFLHQAHHLAMYAWFRNGVLADGSRLPDYLFSVCPWILSGEEEVSAWFGGPEGTRELTVAAVEAMPRFVRGEGPLPSPVPVQEPTWPTEPAPGASELIQGQEWQARVERRPRSDGVRAIAGSLPSPGIRLDVVDVWGNSVTVLSGSKAEYGQGGFEVPVWADAAYTVRFLDEAFRIQVSREVVILTFSEKVPQGEDGGVDEDQSRLITDWMESQTAEELFGDLSRYQGLFALERQ